ncbi:MAG: ABC transporter ATP-binding protein, partial [Christensenellales bacterium]|nr:ABC transporter ATP-binding protein [Christensenellales bacterium]
TMAERIMLNINHIAKTFNPGTITEKRALTDVDLKLNEGDFVTIIGGNGAGKSTTLNAVAGVFTVDKGTIEVDGVDVTRLPEFKRAKYLGRVFQDPMTGTAATMNIEENMALAMRRGEKRTLRWGISNMERDMYREQLRTLGLGLEDRMSSKVGLLSGGQRQALTLLMAALRTPKLLLLDEHTAALDPKTAAKVLELTEKIVAEQKLTAMMVTHNMKDAIAMGNRLIMMNAGRVVVDVRGEEKKKLTREDLMQLFEKAAGQEIANDRMLLS